MNSTDTLVIVAPDGCNEVGRRAIMQRAKESHPGGVVVLPHGCAVEGIGEEAIRAAVLAERKRIHDTAERMAVAVDDAAKGQPEFEQQLAIAMAKSLRALASLT